MNGADTKYERLFCEVCGNKLRQSKVEKKKYVCHKCNIVIVKKQKTLLEEFNEMMRG